ncbi:hypothetical protein AB4K20DRAFT_1906839, partial [Rhizopus microsporus]
MMINTLELQGYIKKKLFQYEIISGAYVMEPWEKITFNTILLLVVGLSFKTLFQFTHRAVDVI